MKVNATGHGYDSGSNGQGVGIGEGHGSNTDQSGSIDDNNTSSGGQVSNTPIIAGTPVENPTGATGHGSAVSSNGQAENKPIIAGTPVANPTGAMGHSAEEKTEEKKAIPDLYMHDGNNYYIDDNALSNAQMGTGDDKKADSVVGSGGSDGSETNSNINTGVFGGPERAAHPGYSLW